MSNIKENKAVELKRLPSVPKDLHAQFKLECVKRGITMQQAAEEAIKNYINTISQSDRGF